jgi:ATP-dependent helicase/nuclease subunit B
LSERIVIGPAEPLVRAVVDRMKIDRRDFSDTAVVFPGKRPSHFLRKELARRVGGSVVPPHIFSIDEFILALYRLLHPEPVKDLESIDALAILHQVHNALTERLGGDYFTSLDSFIPIGLRLFGELEELILADLPEQRVREMLSSFTYGRLFSLAEYYARFYVAVAEKGFTTRAMRYIEVARHCAEIALDQYGQIFVAGLFKFTHAEQTIVKELERRPNVTFVFQSDKLDAATDGPEIQFYKASDTHGQVFALSAIIQERLTKGQALDERSVVVMPSPDALFPLLNFALPALTAEQYNIALGYPAERTPVFSFLRDLMELKCTKQGERYSAAQYIKFVLHPYTKNIRFGQRADVTRILFHALESRLTEDKSKMLISLEEIEESDEVFSNIAFALSAAPEEITAERLKEHVRNIHIRTIRALEQIGSLREFARKLIEVLTYVYEESTARQHPLFRPYAEALLQLFLHIEQSIIGNASFRDAAGYLNFLQQYVSLQEIPFSGTPLRGLQVLGLLETRSLRFDDVFVLDVNEGILPGGAGSDVLLPQQLRERLGLETRKDRDQLVEYYFNVLIRGAKRVHLFFAESDDRDKSRFVERLLWERQKRHGTASSDDIIRSIQYRVKLANESIPAIPKSGHVLSLLRGFSYSASALDTYLQCPIRFYYQHVLRLKEKEEVSEDLDNQDVGLFVHEVMKRFYEPFVGTKLDPKNLSPDRMEQIVEELFVRRFGTEPAGAWYLLKRQIQRQLKAFLTDYQFPVLETTDVVLSGVEEKIAMNTFGYRLEGRIDRIEQRGEKVVIIDYKTAPQPGKKLISERKLDSSERVTWGDAIISLQLPIYLLLYGKHAGVTTEQIVPAYLYIGESRLGKESEAVLWEGVTKPTACFDELRKIIELLLKEINDPTVPFLPPSDLTKTCPRCPYTAICGTSWVGGWKPH